MYFIENMDFMYFFTGLQIRLKEAIRCFYHKSIVLGVLGSWTDKINTLQDFFVIVGRWFEK